MSDLVGAFARGLRPPPRMSLDEWADEHLVLERGGAKVRWSTDKTPYLRDPMRDLSIDSVVEEVVFMKPSQSGGTEALVIAAACYWAVTAPAPILTIRPDIEEAAKFTQLRIDPVLRNTAALRGIFREAKSRDAGNTQHQKLFTGGSWTLVGANSPAGLASIPAPYVQFDETDRTSESAGSGRRAEGDQYLLAKARTRTFRDSFPRRKLVRISSPGDASTSKIAAAWADSSQGRWHMPCPLCGFVAALDFRRLWWGRNAHPKTAAYRCAQCDKLIDERDKPEMLRLGSYMHANPRHDVRGYRMTGLDSPFLGFGEIAAEIYKAKGNPAEMRVVVNTIKGETYDTHEETRVDVRKLKLLATPVEFLDGKPTIPDGVGVLTGGADTHPDRLEHTLRGWGKGDEQWHLDHVIFPGDASGRGVWNDLHAYQRTTWHNASGRAFELAAACVDTGGENTLMAYEFVRHKGPLCVWGIKGKEGQGKALWPRRPTRNNKGKVDLYLIGIDSAKAQLYARLRASVAQVERGEKPGGPGFVHIAAHLCEDIVHPDGTRSPSEYLQQLVAEQPKTVATKTGTVVEWRKPSHRTRNEALDCDVYAQAALAGWKALRRSVDAVVESTPSAPPAAPKPVAPDESSPPGNFLAIVKPSHRQEMQISPPRPTRTAPTHDPRAGRKVARAWDEGDE